MSADLRALLYEPWCRTCGGVACQRAHTPDEIQRVVDGTDCEIPCLAERLPECVPPGLEWQMGCDDGAWWLVTDDPDDDHILTDEQAELLFIGKAVKVFADVKFSHDMDKHTADVGGHHGRGDSKVAALAAALHRLADERGGR